MDNLNISRNLFLGLNNHNATFQLLRSRIETGTRNNKTYYIIPIRVIYRTIWGYYSFIITYNIYQEGDISMDINRKICTKNTDDYMALKAYCETEVYKPCNLLRNYFSILGLIESNTDNTNIVSKYGIWVW